MNSQSVENSDLLGERDLAALYERMLKCIGENVQREGLIKTPRRAADAMKFMTQGYRQRAKDILNNAIFESESDDIVIVRDIEFYSICEHHILPFFGKCHVGYIPDGKIIGLSKISRIVDMYARRLQVQERLTHQIASELNEALNPLGTAVVIEAQHMCMMIRGVQKQSSKAITSAVLGVFRDDPSTKAEWMSLLQVS